MEGKNDSESEIICLTNKDTRIKVSSTLKGSPENTKDKIFDGKSETSWYSSQGKSQYIYVYFDFPIQIKEINFTFDNGFSPKEIEMYISENDEYNNKKPNLNLIKTFSLLETNGIHKLILDENESEKCKNIKTVKFYMKKFSDPFGRVIVYDLKIKGFKKS